MKLHPAQRRTGGIVNSSYSGPPETTVTHSQRITREPTFALATVLSRLSRVQFADPRKCARRRGAHAPATPRLPLASFTLSRSVSAVESRTARSRVGGWHVTFWRRAMLTARA